MLNSVFVFTDQGYVWIATRILLISFCVVYIWPAMMIYFKKHYNIAGSIVLLSTLSVGIILFFPTDLISLFPALLIGITYADTPAGVNPAAVNPAVVNPAVVNPAAVNPAVGNSAVAHPVIYSSTSFVPIPHAIDNILTPTLALFNTGQLRIPQSEKGDLMLTALLRWMRARMHDVGGPEWAAQWASLAVDHYSGSDVKVAKLLCSARLRHLEYLLSHNSGGGGDPTDILITSLAFDDSCLTNLDNILTNIQANNLQQGLTRDVDTSSAASTNESSDTGTSDYESDASTTEAPDSDDSEPSDSSRHSVGFVNSARS